MDYEPKKDKKNHLKRSASLAQYSGLAMQMLGTILIFTYAGVRLDRWQGHQIPGWTIVLSLTGIGASLYMLIRNMPKL
ncbi:AtpZ/AtpI family protein [Dyadobacter tibetensis]|uniref:AtpZ/AtpI family protein n=1 Tax=Dyadobacter tibetensis TaxID=1211851 RepID=UPI0004727ED0|nr:AtpZ/AtpI family protein [Dyadobacter tibetensis]